MNRALILQHDALYGASRLVSVFRDFGIPCDVRKLHEGDALPSDADEIRLLILLGGRMRVSEGGFSRYAFLEPERALARQMVEDDRAVVGIGFGAELLSAAAGASVSELRKPASAEGAPGEPTPEFGWYPITLPFPGGTEPAMFGVPDGASFFMWHVDSFALPALPPPAVAPPPPARPPTGNVLMASSRLCRHQAYRFKTRTFGFQFHFELDAAEIEQIIRERSREAQLSDARVAEMLEATRLHASRYERLSTKLLQNLVQFLKAY